MKKSFLFMAALFSAAMVNAEVVTTSVYSNSFVSETDTPMDGYTMGTPGVTFSVQQIVSAGDPAKSPSSNANSLSLQNKKASGAKGKNILTAPIANFAAPFTSKLSEIKADSVVWTFNYRNNNSNASKGFDDGMNGSASILIADNADLTQGNGYAVIMGKKDPQADKGDKHIYLARYTEGLDANANVTTILQTPECTLKKYWSIRVTYIPASNTWKMAWYEDLSAFVAPAAVTAWTDCGSAVDDTYTGNEMTTFGFLVNYSGGNDNIMYVKNYDVVAYTTGGTTGMAQLNNAKRASKKMVNGVMVVEKDGVLYNVLGGNL